MKDVGSGSAFLDSGAKTSLAGYKLYQICTPTARAPFHRHTSQSSRDQRKKKG